MSSVRLRMQFRSIPINNHLWVSLCSIYCIRKNLIVYSLGVLLSACATSADISADLRQRAQDVFRYHNQLVSQLILVSTDTAISDLDLAKLEQAETQMIKACKPLNKVAAKVRDGGRAGIGQRINIPRTLNDCERQTNVVEQLLSNF